MKRFNWILIVLCFALIVSCERDEKTDIPKGAYALRDGGIIIKHNPDISVNELNIFPEGISVDEEISAGRNRLSVKSTAGEVASANDRPIGNDYRFKLVGEAKTLTINGVETQATHVKITDDAQYAFVSYNSKGNSHAGGVLIFKIEITGNSWETVKAKATPVSMMEMPKAEVSAVDYSDNKLYITGASEDPKLGYSEERDGFNYAFCMVMELKTDKTFNEGVEPAFIRQLTSFQGTSVRAANNRMYVTTGDGTNGTKGGLYIFNTADSKYPQIKFIEGKDYVRSVDIAGSNIYMMQSQPARITQYDPDGEGEKIIYNQAGEAMQSNAKSEILAWNGYLLAALNESGLRMLDGNGAIVDFLGQPGTDPEKHVTNSVAVNSSPKKNFDGGEVKSNLLLLANGEKGIYWYDITEADGKNQIALCNNNSMFFGDNLSSNFVASAGNIVFVADGLGGLKILYIGINEGAPDDPPIENKACTAFMDYLYNLGSVRSLLPPSKSVFRPEADEIIRTLFSDPDNVPEYINILKDTELYLSYIGEWAGWKNSLGFFVIPESVTDHLAYYNSNIKDDLYETVGKTKVLKDKYTIFKNISSDVLNPGETWPIGNFKKGDKVVLFLVPNGWVSQNNRVQISFSSWNQIFFTHAGLNKGTSVGYNSAYRDFTGIQYNTFYSADCKSIVLFFEDNHSTSDVDYNDIIFSISDNGNGEQITDIELPKYTIISSDGGKTPELVSTSSVNP
jgi:hypothetical protein